MIAVKPTFRSGLVFRNFNVISGMGIEKMPVSWIGRNGRVAVEEILAGSLGRYLPMAFVISYHDERFDVSFMVKGTGNTEERAKWVAERKLQNLNSVLSGTLHNFHFSPSLPLVKKYNYSTSFHLGGVPAIKKGQLKGYIDAVEDGSVDSDFYVLCFPGKTGLVEKFLTKREHKSLGKASRHGLISWGSKQRLRYLEEKLERFGSGVKLRVFPYLCTYSNASQSDANRKGEMLKSVVQAIFCSEERRVNIKRIGNAGLVKAMARMEGVGFGTLLKASELAYIDVPAKELPGIESIPEVSFPIHAPYNDGVVIGRVVDSGDNVINPLRFDPTSIFEHLAIWGASGSGKTTAIKNLIMGLMGEINFVIIDWHNEYREIAPLLKRGLDGEVQILNLLKDRFSLNPLEIMESANMDRDILVTERVEDFISLLKQVFIIGEIQESRTRSSLYEVYSQGATFIEDLVARLSNRKPDNLVTKLQKFTQGFYGDIFNKRSSLNFNELEKKTVIFELGDLPTGLRTFFVCVFLILWWDYRRRGSRVPHALVLDEFHHYSGFKVVGKMLSEARKYREGLICSHQGPNQLSDRMLQENLVRNTAAKLVFRLDHAADKRIAAASLGGLSKDQMEYLSLIDVGEAVVKLKGMMRPVRVRMIPLPDLVSVEGDAIHVPRGRQRDDKGYSEPVSSNIGVVDKRFLDFVFKNPNASTFETSKALKIKASRGIGIRERLISEGLLIEEKIRIGTGRPKKVLKLSSKGLSLFNKTKDRPAHHGKEEHVFTVNKIAGYLEKNGWQALVEFDGCDIKALKGGKKVAIEVETGKSKATDQLVHNIKRDLEWADKVVVVCPNSRSRENIIEVGQGFLKKAVVITYDEIRDLEGFLP
jgi:hypothetical protein